MVFLEACYGFGTVSFPMVLFRAMKILYYIYGLIFKDYGLWENMCELLILNT